MKQELSQESLEQFPLSTTKLPKGWSTVLLADIASEITPGFASGQHDSHGGGQPHLRPMNVDRSGQIDLGVVKFVPPNKDRVLAAGDILFNNTNSPELVGKTAVVSWRERGFAYSNHMTRISVDSGISSSFVARQLHYLWMSGYMKHRCTNHVNQASISSKTLAHTVPLLLPPSSEQDRIVEKLDELLSELDAGVAELKAAQRKLAQYRQSLLKAAVEGTLTADWRAARARAGEPQETGVDLLQHILTERRAHWEAKQLAKFAEQGKIPSKGWQEKYSEPVEPSQENRLVLPANWAWATVDQISTAQKYGSSSKTSEGANGVPVLRMGNIQDGRIDLSNLKYLPKEHHEFPDLLLEDGDLLFNRTNSPELVGKTAVYRCEIEPCSYASYLIAVKLAPSCVPEFLSAFINSVHGRSWVKEVVTQQVGQANVNGSKLAALTLPLPPHEEQLEIVARLNAQLRASFDEHALIERGLRQAVAQRKNILKAAFAGQLVAQEPRDEPASALLERICAERAVADHVGAGKRGRKTRKQG